MENFEKRLQKKLQEKGTLKDNETEWTKIKLNNLRNTREVKTPFFKLYKAIAACSIVLLLSVSVYAAAKLDILKKENNPFINHMDGYQELTLGGVFKDNKGQKINKKLISNDEYDMNIDSFFSNSHTMYLGVTYKFKKENFVKRKDLVVSPDLKNVNLKINGVLLTQDNNTGSDRTDYDYYTEVRAMDYNKKEVKVIYSIEDAKNDPNTNYAILNKYDRTVKFGKLVKEAKTVDIGLKQIELKEVDYSPNSNAEPLKLLNTYAVNKSFSIKVDKKINDASIINYKSNSSDISEAKVENDKFSFKMGFKESRDKSISLPCKTLIEFYNDNVTPDNNDKPGTITSLKIVSDKNETYYINGNFDRRIIHYIPKLTGNEKMIEIYRATEKDVDTFVIEIPLKSKNIKKFKFSISNKENTKVIKEYEFDVIK